MDPGCLARFLLNTLAEPRHVNRLTGPLRLSEESAMLKLIRLQHPRYELFAVAALSIAQFAGIDVRRVLQSLRPKVRFGAG